MDRLPIELFYRILSLLDYRHLATTALVCRDWNTSGEHANLWRKLFTRRWGQAKARDVCFKSLKSWKHAYEVQDRCDRLGVTPKIAREGPFYYLVNDGAIVRYLGSTKTSPRLQQLTFLAVDQGDSARLAVPCVEDNLTIQAMKNPVNSSSVCSSATILNEQSQIEEQTGISGRHSQIGLIDSFLFFLGDLESELPSRKRKRTT